MRDHDDFLAQNSEDWRQLISQLFPFALPTHARWHKLGDIIKVLKHIGSISNVNHMFFPDSGGLDLTGAISAPEQGLIALECDSLNYYAKPKHLSFESFGDIESFQWAYFRLELEAIEDTGVYDEFKNFETVTEELLELSPENYANRSYWDAGEYNSEPLPEDARVIIRILGGSLVIFQKTSVYNSISSTYSGNHNGLSEDEFRSQLDALRQGVYDRAADRLQLKGYGPRR